MSKAYVLAHGRRNEQLGYTWVPPGRRVLFYARFDESLPAPSALAVLASGRIRPVHTYEESARIPNYSLSKTTDAQAATQLSSVSSQLDGYLFLVGHSPADNAPATSTGMPPPSRKTMALCTGGDGCGPEGHHRECDGLFAAVNADELHLLSCRSTVASAPRTTDVTIGHLDAFAQDDYLHDVRELIRVVLRDAAKDPFGTLRMVESLPQSTAAILGTSPVVKTWLDVMGNPLNERSSREAIDRSATLVRTYAKGSGDPQARIEKFLRLLPPSTADEIDVALSKGSRKRKRSADVPPAPGTVARCWRQTHHRTRFLEWLHTSHWNDERDRTATIAACDLLGTTVQLYHQLTAADVNTPAVIDELTDALRRLTGPIGLDPHFLRDAEVLVKTAARTETSASLTRTTKALAGAVLHTVDTRLTEHYQRYRSSDGRTTKRARTDTAAAADP